MNGLDLTYGGAFDWLFVCLLFFVSFFVDVILSFVFVFSDTKRGEGGGINYAFRLSLMTSETQNKNRHFYCLPVL